MRARRLVGLVVGGCIALALPGVANAAVFTDQHDYAPGSTVTIGGDNSDGAGYLAGEIVDVSVAGPGALSLSCSATVDSAGAWSCQVTLPPDTSAIGEYAFTATGERSGVSQSGSFSDGGCPSSDPTKWEKDSQVVASYTSSKGTATYSLTTPSKASVGGIPGLIAYCVYPSTSPNSVSALYANLHGAWTAEIDSGHGYFNFQRSDGNPDNVPFDGSSQTMGTATWTSGTVPSGQTIVLHINDEAECSALYGGKVETCFVRPAAAASPLTASKTAQPALERKYTWGIEKSVDHEELTVEPGEPATFNYTVSVTHDAGTDGGWVVSGTISVHNPNAAAVSEVDVTDSINDAGASCKVTGGSKATIAAEATAEFAYTCTYTAKPTSSSETNTATVQWPLQTLSNGSVLAAGSTPATAPVNWAGVTPTVIDGSVSVEDTLGGPLGTVSASDPSPKKFEYPHTFSGDPTGKCTSHPNTASFSTVDTHTEGSASQTVKVCVKEPPPKCVESTIKGVGHNGAPSPGGENFDDNLNTCPGAGIKEQLRFTWAERAHAVGLRKLLSASCVKEGGKEVFSGHGTATLDKMNGYELSFVLTHRTDGKWNLRLAIEKGGIVLQEFIDEPLTTAHQTIVCMG